MTTLLVNQDRLDLIDDDKAENKHIRLLKSRKSLEVGFGDGTTARLMDEAEVHSVAAAEADSRVKSGLATGGDINKAIADGDYATRMNAEKYTDQAVSRLGDNVNNELNNIVNNIIPGVASFEAEKAANKVVAEQVGDGQLNIQVDGVSKGTFTANQKTNLNVNIDVESKVKSVITNSGQDNWTGILGGGLGKVIGAFNNSTGVFKYGPVLNSVYGSMDFTNTGSDYPMECTTKVPTQAKMDNSNKAASTEYVDRVAGKSASEIKAPADPATASNTASPVAFCVGTTPMDIVNMDFFSGAGAMMNSNDGEIYSRHENWSPRGIEELKPNSKYASNALAASLVGNTVTTVEVGCFSGDSWIQATDEVTSETYYYQDCVVMLPMCDPVFDWSKFNAYITSFSKTKGFTHLINRVDLDSIQAFGGQGVRVTARLYAKSNLVSGAVHMAVIRQMNVVDVNPLAFKNERAIY